MINFNNLREVKEKEVLQKVVKQNKSYSEIDCKTKEKVNNILIELSLLV